jgi:hypothetical protein
VVIIQRYKRQDVVIVRLWERQFLKKIEAKIRAGEKPCEKDDSWWSKSTMKSTAVGCGS